MARTVEDVKAPRQPGEAARAPSTRRGPVLGWVIVAVAVGAVAALALVGLPTDHDTKPIGQPLVAEHGSIRAIEGSVEDSTTRSRERRDAHPLVAEHGSIRAIEGSVEDITNCTWTAQVDEPVLPPSDLGARPEPDSLLLFEKCDGEFTGRMTWS